MPLGKCTTPFVFGIRAVDKFGNSRKSGRDSFRVQMSLVSSSSGASSSSAANLQGLITDNNDGTYHCKIISTRKFLIEKDIQQVLRQQRVAITVCK